MNRSKYSTVLLFYLVLLYTFPVDHSSKQNIGQEGWPTRQTR
jgi:hypothetical protein